MATFRGHCSPKYGSKKFLTSKSLSAHSASIKAKICFQPGSHRSLLCRSVECWHLPINPWTWCEQGLTSTVLPLQLSNFSSFAHIIFCQGDIIEHSWWWGRYLGQGKKSINTGWKSELKIRLFDSEIQHRDGCRAELLWSLVEMPVGYKST